MALEKTDNQPGASYTTVRSQFVATGEVTDRKSRFIAQIKHVETEEESAAFIAEVRARHYDARHNVPAQILASGFEKASDDGEPSRTAGMPVLDVLHGNDIKDVCCVVTRYFGGTLLGPGGLVRAYSAAAQAALDAAREQGQLALMCEVVPVELTVAYSQHDRVRDLAQRAGAHIQDTIYAADVTLKLVFRSGEEQDFLRAMQELMAGQDICKVGASQFAEF